MNKPIRTVSIFCLLLFVALMVNISYLQFWRAQEYNALETGNARVDQAAFSRERGQILVGRTPIATSEPSDDRYKYLRTYPEGERYAHVTGYLQLDSRTGIERAQNEVLSGEDPRLFVDRLVDMMQGQANQGGNVTLTLDAAAQQAAHEALLDAVGPEGEGSVVAIEPTTGRILAVVSLPSYDPNDLATHDFDAARESYDRLDPTDGDGNEREPLLNRAIQTRLAPGSTFKIVTAAAALEAGLYRGDDEVPSGATWQLPGTSGDQNVVDNEGRSACDSTEISFTTAMAASCNTAFAKMAVDVGPEEMRAQAEAFGFNSDYLLDLPNQAQSRYPESVTDVVDGEEQPARELNSAETARTGFGQFEVQATPLQMAMVVSAIANRGTLMRPHLVQNVQSADYEIVESAEAEELRDAISPQTAAQLTDLLVATASPGGTAYPAAIDGVSVAGKTGTAQRGIPGEPPYAWFTSFAPAEDAQVAVAVMIQEAPGKSISGGGLGGPVAKAVMEAVLQ